MTPDDRHYSKTHEWVTVEDGIATVGITEYAQEQLGDITYVELPPGGKIFEQGDECGVVESVKAASDIYSPVGGQVFEVNADLEEKPEMINADPYGDGWIMRLKNVNEEELETLLTAREYDKIKMDQ